MAAFIRRAAAKIAACGRQHSISRLAIGRKFSSQPASDDVHHAVVSIFDLFSIGIGPSSSHTVGPMRAANIFVHDLEKLKLLSRVQKLRVDLYGSLALTGAGHGTPNAILLGLEGESPEAVDTNSIADRVEAIYTGRGLKVRGVHDIAFKPSEDLVFNMSVALPQHPNGMRFCAFDGAGTLIATNTYFSIGGGFVISLKAEAQHGENAFFRADESSYVSGVLETGKQSQVSSNSPTPAMNATRETPDILRISQDLVVAALPFTNAADLLDICRTKNLTIAQVVLKNELQWRQSHAEVQRGIMRIWNAMNSSIMNGINSNEAFLPGDLKVSRRAPALYRKLMVGTVDSSGVHHQHKNISAPGVARSAAPQKSPTAVSVAEEKPTADNVETLLPSNYMRSFQRRLPALDWLSLFAISVNEENAAGGRVVTAPTNGAAGVIPAVLKYYLEFISITPPHKQANEITEFLLTAAAIGMLYKRGSSISAAEVGCQGEVGVACSMSAAGLCAVMGGTVSQIENAAEIGMEHNLGLTCDPIGGLVQIPCIERNALGAVKAVTAAQLSLHGDGLHRVSLDQVIQTMKQTGMDMQAKYKETSLGGLAVNVPVC